jgi:hypothetical protein
MTEQQLTIGKTILKQKIIELMVFLTLAQVINEEDPLYIKRILFGCSLALHFLTFFLR